MWGLAEHTLASRLIRLNAPKLPINVGMVGVAAQNTNLTPLVTGPVIQLSERHAKTRSNHELAC